MGGARARRCGSKCCGRLCPQARLVAMHRVKVLIQSRLGSSRLPGKALLPIAGYPAVVLCALRAGNSGLDVQVATSFESGDELTANYLEMHGIPCVRGPLDDVLSRLYLATVDLPVNATLVRLTADNIVPDGTFIQRLIKIFRREGLQYLGTASPGDGLPYGLSAEVLSVGVLRQAYRASAESNDREHVTPWIKRNSERTRFVQGGADLGLSDHSHLRCTLDDLDDYLHLTALFADIADPVNCPWQTVVEKMSFSRSAPKYRVPAKETATEQISAMTLGTAQLGLDYGAGNKTGRWSNETRDSILELAVATGVTHIDTARAYGDAETRLGEFFGKRFRGRAKIITKLDPLTELPEDLPYSTLRQAVDASIFRSCTELGTRQLDVVLLHRWTLRKQHSGNVWKRLLELKAQGRIDKLGASVSTPAEAAEAAADTNLHYLQIPLNVLDHRWRSDAAFQSALRAREDLVVFVRSALLQGILTGDAQDWPAFPNVNADNWIGRLDKLVKALGRLNRADLCLAYVRGLPWVASIVLGVDNVAQLQENIRLFSMPALMDDELAQVEQELCDAPPALLDPSQWPKKRV